ncbi:MAG: hypothetical protein QNK37_28270 [Acidobacteriota bacterium]|nr:hypothetical protein [Acidobacteriota bacterium]
MGDVAHARLYSITDSGKLVKGQGFEIPIQEDLFYTKADPTGKDSLIQRFELLGKAGERIFISDTRKSRVLVFDIPTKSLTEMPAGTPKYPERVHALADKLLFLAKGVLYSPRPRECGNAHFTIHTQDGSRVRCLGDGKNIYKDFDLPRTFYHPEENYVGIYYRKIGDLHRYPLTGDTPSDVIQTDHTDLKAVEKAAPFGTVFPLGKTLFHLSVGKTRTYVFSLEGNRWQSRQEIDGAFKKGLLFLNYFVGVTEGGEIEIRSVDII